MNIFDLLNRASEIEKKAYSDYVANFTKSGIVALVGGGVPFEKAAQLMREACENDIGLAARKTNAVAFEKAAEYISELETKLSEVEKVAEEAVVEAKKNDETNPLYKLASIGFSDEEIAMMAQLPNNLVEKVASANSQPWEMGGAVGVARERTDPLLEFLLT